MALMRLAGVVMRLVELPWLGGGQLAWGMIEFLEMRY